jgi:hypothetical protein
MSGRLPGEIEVNYKKSPDSLYTDGDLNQMPSEYEFWELQLHVIPLLSITDESAALSFGSGHSVLLSKAIPVTGRGGP